ncbi:MAG: alpha/beta fold hydrolase, partial [Actinomycetota bacterium]
TARPTDTSAGVTARPTDTAAFHDDRITWLRHNRVDLALHELRSGEATTRPLLVLHGLGESAPTDVPGWVDWRGPVHALDFTGHGRSTVPAGGGYQSEMLLGDADHALAHLVEHGAADTVTVVGRGLGAYVALQLAGARAERVHGAVLLDGPGLAGGATGPSSMSYTHVPDTEIGRAPDPYALIELSRELRPADYATSFVRLANAGSPARAPIVVCSTFRPTWLAAVADAPGVADTSLADAFTLLD